MPPLYLVEQGAVVQRDGERIVVRKDEVLLSVPVFKVENVLIFGHVQLTTQAIGLLLGHGVEVSFFTMTGRLKGRLISAVSKNVLLRVHQFSRAQEESFCLNVAKRMIRAKIHNARILLIRFARNHRETPLERAIDQLGEILQEIQHVSTLNALRGKEGVAAAIYFRALGHMIRGDFAFKRRQKRPPRDPVNALLSLGYTLLTNEIMGRASAHGFDPYLGFYHTLRYGRPSLALDLVEEFRHTVIDRLVLRLVNRRVIQPDDFEVREKDGAVVLKTPMFKQFLAAYEEHMRRPRALRRRPKDLPEGRPITYRDLVDLQVRRLARTVQTEAPYQPFWAEE